MNIFESIKRIYNSPNDISDMVNQIYILNFMLFKQKYTKIFLILGGVIFFATGVIFLQRVTFFLQQVSFFFAHGVIFLHTSVLI